MTTPRVQELVNHLVGTCAAIIEEQEGWTPEELAAFDDECFCCEICSWWYRIEDLGGEGDQLICTGCTGDEE